MKLPCLLLLVCAAFLPARAQTIPKGDIVVDVEPFAALPTSDNGQTARANLLAPAPDGRIFANDQRGELYTISADGSTVTLYLDLSSTTPLLFDNGERGFQAFAFHPDFNVAGAPGFGKFYTMASQKDTSAAPTFTPGVAGAARDHDEVLLEWTAADPAAATFVPADPAHPFREVLRISRPSSNHNAGMLAFNSTAPAGSADYGNLYIGTGDSGGVGDPLGLAQAPGKIYGAVLRINPLPAGTQPYGIPADNPYVTNSAFLPEVFARGFRNPQRFTWDAKDGRMFLSDVGQGRVEELDIVTAGANYGWNKREGDFTYNSDDSEGVNTRGDASGFTYPVAEYLHFGSIGNAVAVGPVVRSNISALLGRVIFSDFPTGTPYTVDADAATSVGAPATVTELRLRQGGVELTFMDLIHQTTPGATRADLRFGTDAQHNVYLLDKQDGFIRRIVADLPPPPPPVVEPPVVVPPPVVEPPMAGLPVVSATADVPAISRGAGETATITLTRTGDASAPLRVNFLLLGSALNGRDYEQRPISRNIKAGQSSVVLRIKPLAGGLVGNVKLVIQPDPAYTVDASARKAKVMLTD